MSVESLMLDNFDVAHWGKRLHEPDKYNPGSDIFFQNLMFCWQKMVTRFKAQQWCCRLFGLCCLVDKKIFSNRLRGL